MKIFSVSDTFNGILSLNSVLSRRKSDENGNEEELGKKAVLRQCLVASGPLLLTVGLGMTSGYSAILLPQLNDPASPIRINPSTASWIASLAALPMALGCILGGLSMEHFGRKSAHFITIIPNAIGWAFIIFSNSFATLCIGRFLTGLSCGLLGPVTGVYISETSSPTLRGILLAFISLSVSLGLLLVHFIGTFYTWTTTGIVAAIIPLLSSLILLLAPESPSWLIKNGQIDEARACFEWCRGKTADTQKEFNEIVEKQNQITKNANTNNEKPKLLTRGFLKPLAIMTVFIVANQWAGVNALTFYTVEIMNKTFANSINNYFAMILLDFIRFVISLLTCYLLKRIPRRPLAIASGLGTTASLLLLALTTFIANRMANGEEKALSAVSMTALMAYIAFITIGFVPLPWAMMGEVFPLAHRNIGTSICACMAFMAFFSVVKSTPAMFEGLGSEGAFLCFGVVALLGTVFVWVFLPETKDRTLAEIEDEFSRK